MGAPGRRARGPELPRAGPSRRRGRAEGGGRSHAWACAEGGGRSHAWARADPAGGVPPRHGHRPGLDLAGGRAPAPLRRREAYRRPVTERGRGRRGAGDGRGGGAAAREGWRSTGAGREGGGGPPGRRGRPAVVAGAAPARRGRRAAAAPGRARAAVAVALARRKQGADVRSGRVRESQDGSGKKRGESTQLKEISRKEACPQILLTWKETGEEADTQCSR